MAKYKYKMTNPHCPMCGSTIVSLRQTFQYVEVENKLHICDSSKHYECDTCFYTWEPKDDINLRFFKNEN